MFASKDTLLTRPSGYQIQRSVRLRSSASGNLSRTPSTSNRKTWTYSGWVKRGAVGVNGRLLGVYGTTDSTYVEFGFSSSDTLAFGYYSGNWRITSQVFRDPSAWYHITLAFDTTQATAANRVKLYINGVEVTAFGTNNNPTQNSDWAVNNNQAHHLFQNGNSGNYFDGYATEINFIDGQALTPSSFGAINPVTGVWSATKYAGTYGTNGFYLNFTDNSAATATTIGKDYSGNGNNWTPNNISVTAGSTYDSMLDAPLGTGGLERGNYATLNSLFVGQATISSGFTGSANTISDGNLKTSVGASSAQSGSIGTFGVTTGKWYFEVNVGAVSTGNDSIGFIQTFNGGNSYDGYRSSGLIYNEGATTSGYATWTAGDTIAMALDCGAGTLACYKNNTLIATISITGGVVAPMFPLIWIRDTTNSAFYNANFGQRPFSYTPPTGFKALHTGNLAAPVIALPAQNMAATLYTGTGATQSISNAVNSVSMQPDWVWFKRRGAAENHWLTDSVRGSTKGLFSNLTDAEATRTDQLTSFNSNGFTLGADAAGYSNGSGQSYVAWQWKAGGTAVSNTAGSITSSVSANTTAGFSVATYTGNGTAGATVGHGLGAAPSMVIIKVRNAADNWPVYHVSLGNANAMFLNTTAQSQALTYWNSTTPSSTVFTLGSNLIVNKSSDTFVAYCFTPVAGYSAFGSYTGNGSNDGPFVYLGFRPRWLLIKTTGVENWFVFDSARGTYNPSNPYLLPNSSGAEGAFSAPDMLSNGFKMTTNSIALNVSAQQYIFAAFAESPFKNSLAR